MKNIKRLIIFFSFVSTVAFGFDVEYLSWEEIESSCQRIAEKIKSENVPIDMIIGISRGGLIPSRILADQLDLKDLYVVKISFYTGIGLTADKPIIKQPLLMSLEGKTVLLVDDIVDTGGSMKAAVEYVKSLQAKEVYTASLHVKNTSPFKSDFFAYEKNSWLVYPWEKNEAKREIAEMLSK